MKILKTNDYNLFKFNEFNRKISRSHVEHFKKILIISNLLEIYPIVCNKDMEIIDGQHRFMACKELGIEIAYSVHEELRDKDIIALNSVSAPWKNDDYIGYYCKKGVEPYLRLRDLCKRYHLPVRCIVLFSKTPLVNWGLQVKSGKLDLLPLQEIESKLEYVIRCLDWLRIHMDKSVKSLLNNDRFITGMVKFFNHEDIDKEKGLEKLTRYFNKMHYCSSIQDYMKMFVNIYNIRNSSPVDIDGHYNISFRKKWNTYDDNQPELFT